MATAPQTEQDQDKALTIIVNGRPKTVTEDELTFEAVADLAFNNNPPSGPNIVITITFSKAKHPKEGSLLPGQTVEVKAGTIFNVTATDKS